MTIHIRSWYLARSLGITKQPPSECDWIEVVIEGGPMLFWPRVPEQAKVVRSA